MKLPLPGHVSRNYPGKSGTDSNYVSTSPSCLSQLSDYVSEFSSDIIAHHSIFSPYSMRDYNGKIQLSNFSIDRVVRRLFPGTIFEKLNQVQSRFSCSCAGTTFAYFRFENPN